MQVAVAGEAERFEEQNRSLKIAHWNVDEQLVRVHRFGAGVSDRWRSLSCGHGRDLLICVQDQMLERAVGALVMAAFRIVADIVFSSELSHR
jgi:hypothetical protein